MEYGVWTMEKMRVNKRTKREKDKKRKGEKDERTKGYFDGGRISLEYRIFENTPYSTFQVRPAEEIT